MLAPDQGWHKTIQSKNLLKYVSKFFYKKPKLKNHIPTDSGFSSCTFFSAELSFSLVVMVELAANSTTTIHL